MGNVRKDHWEQVYASKAADAVSWFQNDRIPSLAMIAEAGIGRAAAILDVRGGISVLVDRLLDGALRMLPCSTYRRTR